MIIDEVEGVIMSAREKYFHMLRKIDKMDEELGFLVIVQDLALPYIYRTRSIGK